MWLTYHLMVTVIEIDWCCLYICEREVSGKAVFNLRSRLILFSLHVIRSKIAFPFSGNFVGLSDIVDYNACFCHCLEAYRWV